MIKNKIGLSINKPIVEYHFDKIFKIVDIHTHIHNILWWKYFLRINYGFLGSFCAFFEFFEKTKKFSY